MTISELLLSSFDRNLTISWTLRMMLSRHTFCKQEQCSLINLAFQLVCWDSLGLTIPRSSGSLRVVCVLWGDGQAQARLAG